MTRAERKAEQKIQLGRVAVRVLATMTAKAIIKNQIRADGLRISDFSAKTLTLMAEEYFMKHQAEMIEEGKRKAAALGYI